MLGRSRRMRGGNRDGVGIVVDGGLLGSRLRVLRCRCPLLGKGGGRVSNDIRYTYLIGGLEIK